MLDIRKRTGYLFLTVMMAQVILVSAQVQTKSGVKVLQAVTFELFSRVQFGTASGLNFVRHGWSNYVALRGVKGENDALRRQGGGAGGEAPAGARAGGAHASSSRR